MSEVVVPPLERGFIEADTMVLAVGCIQKMDQELLEIAKKIAKEVYVIGDAKKPRKIIDATQEGFFTTMKI